MRVEIGYARVPAAEVAIDAALVRRLLASQHPDLAGRELRFCASGWDNALYRLGDELLVRLPRRQVGADLVEHEQRWLPQLAAALPLPIAAPLRRGAPSDEYPWRWSICPFFAGRDGLHRAPTAQDTAARLGAFVAALHVPAPVGAPANRYRGVPLAQRDPLTRRQIESLAGLLDAPALLAVWDDALAAEPFTGAPLWLHGDLHPGNLIVGQDGEVAAVIDFGDLTAGDPATDLALGWMLFDQSEQRRDFWNTAGATGSALHRRTRGWALALAVACLAHSADAPEMKRLGETTIDRLLTAGE